MIAYTETELLTLVQKAKSRDELYTVADHVFDYKKFYADIWIKFNDMCMKKLTRI